VIRTFLLCSVLAFSASACSKGGDEALMEKSIGMMEDLGKAIESAGGDCGKMATSVGDYVKSHEGLIKEIKAEGEAIKKDEARAKAMAKSAEKYKDRLMKAMPAMMGMAKCADDPKMKEISEKLKGLM
jgi:hypothetical protein